MADCIRPPVASHFKNTEYPLSELAHLLEKIPPDFFVKPSLNPETAPIVAAAAQHARNAHFTLVSSVEILGRLLFVVSEKQYDIDRKYSGEIGYLIAHLSAFVQFVKEKEDSFTQALRGWPGPIVAFDTERITQ